MGISLAAETLGSGALGIGVVGSGIAAQRLTPDPALELAINAACTAAVLFVVIATVARLSGAHLNPIVSIVDAALGRTPWRSVAPYAAAQLVGFALGVMLANAMFAVPVVSISHTDRLSLASALAEVVATAGLVLVIFVAAPRSDVVTAALVGAYIGAAYYFASSTSFANPALTFARTLTDSFAGIAPLSALGFVGAQVIGGGVGLMCVLVVRRSDRAQARATRVNVSR